MLDLLLVEDDRDTRVAELAKAPWPVYKMRAAVSLGRSLQAQGKHAEARTLLDAALKLDCGTGLGAATHITGAFAFAAVGKALEILLKPDKPL